MSQASEFRPLLNQSVGYGVVVGVGFFFAFVMLGLTLLQARYTDTSPTESEEFATASRSVKPGLVCCGIVSAWTWSATLLQSSTAAYSFGVSGPCGLRATFVCDWSHTLILFVVIYIFLFRTFATSQETQGVSGLYDLLVKAGAELPVTGNINGSYLTMKSNDGLVFGAATILSGFAGVFCDQGYWQRAIASHPTSTTKAYVSACRQKDPLISSAPHVMLTSPASSALDARRNKPAQFYHALRFRFAVPFAFASCLGLAARALQNNPLFPTFPNPLSASQTSAGLAAPAAAVVIMGKGGAIAILLVVLGVVLSPAVIPIALTVTWSKLTTAGVILGPVLGAVLGMLAWMIGCWKIYGSITITNLANPFSAVCSGLTGLLFSGIITVGVSLWSPADYDFHGTRNIANLDSIVPPSESNPHIKDPFPSGGVEGGHHAESSVQSEKAGSTEVEAGSVDQQVLQSAFKRALWYSATLTAIVTIIGGVSEFIYSWRLITSYEIDTLLTVPLPMFFSHYTFSKPFFKFWISISM
ncbi:hypothetical protein CVT24_008732 [Panaeolus cyanescens]|uniref:Urea transporter n=1 Tax=Panaeolus cyanescens TaxID=181874 RepID=A0A409VB06_9AGAR|nr:hypothetical protein CVT24_008732 [Panaeolus cyanescens]